VLLLPKGDSGGSGAPALKALPLPLPSWPLLKLAAGAPVEGKDSGGRASPFLSIPLPLSLSLSLSLSR